MNKEIPFYTESEIEELGEDNLHYPYSDKYATYDAKKHQYRLTEAYFIQNGVDLQSNESLGQDTNRVERFLKYLQLKVYTRIYTHNRSTRSQLNYLIAQKGINGYTPYEYREAFLEMMFLEGTYLLDNGDISQITGIDLDTMQNMSADVMRNQDRDWHKDAILQLKTLGLEFYGKYKFLPQGEDW